MNRVRLLCVHLSIAVMYGVWGDLQSVHVDAALTNAGTTESDTIQPLLSCDVCAVFTQELRISIAKREGAYIPTSLPLPIRFIHKYLNPFSETFCFRRAFLKIQYYLERGVSHLTVPLGMDSRDVMPSPEDLKISNAVAYYQWANMGTSVAQTLLLQPTSQSSKKPVEFKNDGMSDSIEFYYLRLEPAICEAYIETVSQFAAHIHPASKEDSGQPRGTLVGREVPADRASAINDDAHAFKAPPQWVVPQIVYDVIIENLEWVIKYFHNLSTRQDSVDAPPPSLVRSECTGCQLAYPADEWQDGDEVRKQLGDHLFGDTPLLTDPSIPNSCFSKMSLMSTPSDSSTSTSKIDAELSADTTNSQLLALLKLNAVVGTSVHLLQEEYQQAFPMRMLTSDIVQLGPISPASIMDILCKPSQPRVLSTLRSPNPSAFSTAMCHDMMGVTEAVIDDDTAIYKWLLPINERVDNSKIYDGVSSWLTTSWFTHDAKYYKDFYIELFDMSIKLLRTTQI